MQIALQAGAIIFEVESAFWVVILVVENFAGFVLLDGLVMVKEYGFGLRGCSECFGFIGDTACLIDNFWYTLGFSKCSS